MVSEQLCARGIHHTSMYRWARAIPFIQVTMALNPYAAPFVKGSGSASSTVSSSGKSTIATAPKVYCDLDGCLVDFEKGCRAVFSGKNPSELTPKVMWGGLSRTKGFCEFEDCRVCCGHDNHLLDMLPSALQSAATTLYLVPGICRPTLFS